MYRGRLADTLRVQICLCVCDSMLIALSFCTGWGEGLAGRLLTRGFYVLFPSRGFVALWFWWLLAMGPV